MVVRFGCATRCDLPWLQKYAQEVRSAAQALTRLPKYRYLNDMYANRPNPLFSRLAVILSYPERSTLQGITTGLSIVGSSPYCWMFDGGIYSCSPPYKRILIVDKLEEVALELQVGGSIKPFKGELQPRFASIPTQLVREGCYTGWTQRLPMLRGNYLCLFNSVWYLAPDTTHFRADVEYSDGPYSVHDFNMSDVDKVYLFIKPKLRDSSRWHGKPSLTVPIISICSSTFQSI